MSTPSESTPRVETALQVMFFDTDSGGVVHNTAYLRFVEVARCHLAELLGMPLTAMTERIPVVVRTEIDYRRPGRIGEHLVVHGWLESLARSRFWVAFEIIRPSDGVRLITCRQMMAIVQMPEGRAIRVPEEWTTRYPHLLTQESVPEAR